MPGDEILRCCNIIRRSATHASADRHLVKTERRQRDERSDHQNPNQHDECRIERREDNADAHLKRTIMGREVVVAITDGKLDLGPWEQIFYGEFDGRRKKRVLVKLIGE